METTPEFTYRRYMIDLRFLNGLAGGTPANRTLAAWHARKFQEGAANALKLSKKVEGDVSEEAVEKYIEDLSSVFPVDDNGIYITGNQICAMLKDSAQRMKATLKQKGLGNTIRDGGVIFPLRIYLGVEPSFVERPVKPDNGPANIKRFQVAEGVALSIPCAVLNNGDLDDALWRAMWRQGQLVGLGASRHLGYGQFRVLDIREEKEWEMEDILDGKVAATPLVLPAKNGHKPDKALVGTAGARR